MEILNYFNLNLFSTFFISIFLEALPFLLFGSLLSSIIEVFISENFFKRVIPENIFLGLLVSSFTGLIFPVCECAIIPVIGRLLKKGVPLYICISLMLSIPIVNVTVILSTYYAFLTHIHIIILRISLGVIIPMIIGFLISLLKNDDIFVKENTHLCDCGNSNCCEHEHSEDHNHEIKESFYKKIKHVFEHTNEEFFETGKYFIIGAFLTAIFQTVIPRDVFSGISGNLFISMILMMIFAFFLSVCSNTDAFIARSFIGQFTQGSILAFIVFGAMIDLKNTIMLTKIFNKKFVFFLICLIAFVCFIVIGFISMFLKG